MSEDARAEAERALLAERLLAEQEERRRLAELLHDGPVQHLSAIAQMVDAALDAVRAGERERGEEILVRTLELAREASRDLRALCDDLEPRTLRELGFGAAVSALGKRVAERHDLEVELDVEPGGALGEHAQAALYQLLRETVEQAVRRGPPRRLEIALRATPNGGAELVVADDGPPERRSAVLEALADRAAALNASFSSEVRFPRGTTIRVELPPSAAGR
ncbi:MAG TPA: histidine kinase [Gaiellaceae bacterium]|nr:histidine kinase [Gaiellaceae bacterium]